MIIDISKELTKKQFQYIYDLAILYLIKNNLYSNDLIRINKDDSFLFEVSIDNQIFDIFKGYARKSNQPASLKSNISQGVNISCLKPQPDFEYLRIDYINLLENANYDKYEAKLISKFLSYAGNGTKSKEFKQIQSLLKLYNIIKDKISKNRLDIYITSLRFETLEKIIRTYL